MRTLLFNQDMGIHIVSCLFSQDRAVLLCMVPATYMYRVLSTEGGRGRLPPKRFASDIHYHISVEI